MSEIADFINTQCDRIEKQECGRYTVSYPLKAPCPVCADRPGGFQSGRVGSDEVRLEPCGHEIPNAEFVDLYAESSPDEFVLVDIESKRRIVELHGDQHECTDTRASEFPYIGCETLRLLAAPFSAEPGYKQEWAA